jgi:hypothetical protein
VKKNTDSGKMTRQQIDESLRVISLFKRYHMAISAKEKINWDILKGKLIDKSDIDRLLYVMGVIGDQRIINPTDTHWRKSRHYRCMNCSSFKLHFEQDEDNDSNDEIKFMLKERNIVYHNSDCTVTNKTLSKGIHIIQESQFLIDLIKTSNYGTDPKKEHDCKMLLSTIGAYDFNITSRTINRAIANIRSQFVKEFVNYYNMVVGYLKVYVQTHPSALTVV